MRLLNATTYKFHEYVGRDAPEYAILSHTWGEGEVTFHDMRPEAPPESWQAKLGWDKIQKCCLQALADCIQFVWVDTCCIDKSSSAELQEAINSMFRWYEESTECYVFVADFEAPRGDVEVGWLKSARWWTRGWTLQELLAPESVRFFDLQWREFGDKVSLRQQVAAITGISEATLLGTVIGSRQALDRVSVAQRMSWAARRETTRAEDTAYSLLGIFSVNMPLLYGEGGSAAFHRLQVEIMGSSPDQSLLAWGFDRAESGASPWGVSNALATSPADFSQCGSMLARGVARPGDVFAMTQRGLRLKLPVVMSLDCDNLIYCALNCTVTERVPADGDVRAARVLAVPFLRPQTRADGLRPHADEYYRLLARVPLWVEREALADAPRMELYMPRVFRHGHPANQRLQVNIGLGPLPAEWYVAGMFPPEKSQHDCIVVRPRASKSAAAVLVHLASSSTNRELSDFVLVVELQQSAKHEDGLIQHSSFEPTPPTAQVLHVPLQRPLTLATLRESVFSVVANVTQVDIKTLSEDMDLGDLGVDSFSSMDIASELARMLSIDGLHWHMLMGVASISDILRSLRFVTRPSFGLVGNSFTGYEAAARHGLGLSNRRFSADEARYCFVEVPSYFSLADLGVGDDAFWNNLDGRWKKLERSDTHTVIQTPLEGYSIKFRI